MARMKKTEVIEALRAIPDLEFDENANYNDLCRLLKEKTKYDDKIPAIGSIPDTGPAVTLGQIIIFNRLKKRPTFLADAVRDQRDDEFLNRELSKREHKGKILRTTRIKEYEVSADGFWVTKFIIDLKE